MAMKSCRECGQQVSSEAKVCPGCGVKKPYKSPVRGLIFLFIIGFSIFKECSGEKIASTDFSPDNTTTTSSSVLASVPVDKASADTKPFTTSQVCKAAIAGLFDRKLKTIKAAKTNTVGIYKITYRRPSDNQLFSYECKLSGNNVIWTESGQSSDRWNGTGIVDFNLEFAIKDATLVMTETYGMSDDVTHKFTMNNFR